MNFLFYIFPIYGIESSDFRKFLLSSFEVLGVKTPEELNKILLPVLETEINIVFQKRLGTGTIQVKNQKKFDLSKLRKEFWNQVKSNEVKIKKSTAYFYIGFSLFMLGFAGFFVWVLMNKSIWGLSPRLSVRRQAYL